MDSPQVLPSSSITANIPEDQQDNLRPGGDVATFPAGSNPSVTIDLSPISQTVVELRSVELPNSNNVKSLRVYSVDDQGAETELTPTPEVRFAIKYQILNRQMRLGLVIKPQLARIKP